MDTVELWKQRKKEIGMTNKDISEKSGIPLRTIEKIMCRQTGFPRIDTAQAIEKALGLSEDVDKISAPKLYDLTEKEKRLLDAFRALIPSLQDYLIETAEKLVEASSNGSKIEKRKA